MPETLVSSHLPERKRGGGGGPATLATAPASSVIASETGVGEKDRGVGRRGNVDNLTGLPYSISDAASVPPLASCDAGHSGVPFVPGSTTFSSGGYIQESEGSGLISFHTSGMDSARLQQQLTEYTDSLFAEGFLDEQFTQLQVLQDENNPDFVSEVVSLFFEDSEKLLEQLTELLDGDPVDYKKIDAHVHQFKGSSSSIGAQRVKVACITFRTCCEEENREGCRQALVQVKQEFYLVKAKLETMLALEQQVLAAGGTLPLME